MNSSAPTLFLRWLCMYIPLSLLCCLVIETAFVERTALAQSKLAQSKLAQSNGKRDSTRRDKRNERVERVENAAWNPTQPTTSVLQSTPKNTKPREAQAYLGGYIGAALLLHDANFTGITACATCNTTPFGAQTGMGFAGGVEGLMPFSSTPSILWGQLRLGGFWTQGQFATQEFIGRVNNPSTGGVDSAVSRHMLSFSLLSLTAEPALQYMPLQNLTIDAGVRLNVSLSSRYDYNEALLAPDYARFADGSASRLVQSGSLTPQFHLGIDPFAGISYRLALSEQIILAPYARFYLPLADITSTQRALRPLQTGGSMNSQRDAASGSWRVLGLQGGLSLTIGLLKPYPTETKFFRDTTIVYTDAFDDAVRLLSSESSTELVENYGLTIERTTVREKYVREVSKRNSLRLDLKVVGIGVDGDEQENPTVVVEEFESEQYMPLLPYIYFPEGKDSLQLTRQNLLPNARVAERWSEADVQEDLLGVFSDLLNVVGWRMKAQPESRITLTGCNSNTGVETNNTELSRRRALAVADYLTSVWGIAPERITTRAQNIPTRPARLDTKDGIEENRRVELETTPESILAPLRYADISVEVTPPTLELTPLIQAPAGLSWWYMYVKQRGTLLKQFSGAEPSAQRWIISRSLLSEGQELPLTATLQAADQSGRQGNVSKDVNVKQITVKKKRVEMLNDKRIDRFSFIMFDYDKSIIEAENVKSLIGQVKEKISPTSTVIIAGYGDRSGSREYNRDLAARRCAEVQKLLQVPENQLVIKPVGNARLVQDNDLPEGRAYSRIVQITIETPIKPGTAPLPRKIRKKS